MGKLIPLTFLLVLFASCKNDSCNTVSCQNGGLCSQGKCQCITPYGGLNCETNLCDSVVCHNGGACVSGICKCAAGYEGIHCDSLVTTKFTGTFFCTQACQSGNSTYNVTVSATGPVSGSNITFFSLDSLQPVAVVNAYAINIQSQPLQTGQTVSGSGQLSLSRDTINLSMTVIPSGSTTGTTCNYTLVRQ